MRHALYVLGVLAFGLSALPASAQEQQEALRPPQAGAPQPPVFEMVAADRETAWRLNRVTGEMVVCRLDTTSSLDTVRARCSPAVVESGGPQQGAGRP